MKAQELPFALLSDPDGSLATKYASLMANGRMAARVTFVIDPEGVVRHVDRKVDVNSHGDDLLKIVEALQAAHGK